MSLFAVRLIVPATPAGLDSPLDVIEVGVEAPDTYTAVAKAVWLNRSHLSVTWPLVEWVRPYTDEEHRRLPWKEWTTWTTRTPA